MPLVDIFSNKSNLAPTTNNNDNIKRNVSRTRQDRVINKVKVKRQKRKLDNEELKSCVNNVKEEEELFPKKETKNVKKRRKLSVKKYPLGGGGIYKGKKLLELQQEKLDRGIEILEEISEEGPIQFVHCGEKEAKVKKFSFRIINIKRKIRDNINNKILIEKERKYKCETENCNHGHLYAQKCHFVRHARTDHAQLRFKCQYCGKEFRQSTQKNEHLKSKHKNICEKWQCPYGCNQHFAQLRGVWRHVNADRKCDSRPKYFTKREINILKNKWSNSEMSQILKFSHHISPNIPKENVVTKEMQINIRKKVKQLIQKYRLNDI